MDKLLTVKKRETNDLPKSLAILSAPSLSIDTVLFSPLVGDIKAWLSDEKNDAGFVSGPCGSGVTTLMTCVIRELGMESHTIDHLSKNFTTMLEDSNKIHTSIEGKKIIVVIDGIDSSAVGKRILTIVSDHVKNGSKHKFVCVGHRERSSGSNDFAKKWKQFHFDAPTESRMFETLSRINEGRLTDVTLAKIVRANPHGDIRSCINSLEIELRRPGKQIDGRDSFVDGIDAIEYMLSKDDATFSDVYKIYEQEPMMTSTGVFENYLRYFKSSDTISRLADSLSSSDVVSERMMSTQDWGLQYAHCAFSVGDVKMSLETNKKLIVEKFGTVWSKSNNQRMNAKKLSMVRQKRQEASLTDLDVMDLDILRMILRKNMNTPVFAKTCEPLEEKEVLSLFRTGFQSYTHDKKKFKNVT